MATGQHYKAYKHAAYTVAKTRQVVMLYDGAIRFLAQAKEAIETNDIERRYNTLTRASEIVSGLQACLYFEAGEQAAQALFDFYSTIDLRIMQLHRTQDLEVLQQVITDIKEMREVWNGIDRISESDSSELPPPDPLAPTVVSA
jgi:flagellar protein FliS